MQGLRVIKVPVLEKAEEEEAVWFYCWLDMVTDEYRENARGCKINS